MYKNKIACTLLTPIALALLSAPASAAITLYDEDGTTFVFEAGDEFKQLHTNELDEMILASPAMAEDRLIMRTKTKLYSFRTP